MKPFAFIQYEDDGPVRYGIDRVLWLIIKHGFEPKDFCFQQFYYLPQWLEDSFSTNFTEGAARLGKHIIVTVAQQKGVSLENYIPDILEGRYARFLVSLRKCHKCNHFMVTRAKHDRYTFPFYHELTFDAQAKRAGFRIDSGVKVDGHPICEDCVKAGKADFLCALCKKRKPTDMIQEQYGDPAEYLCSECYETVPAKVWEQKLDELYESHKYDFC